MKLPSPVRSAISSKITDEHLSEELRVLYVALTRAKEKLILIGSTDSHKKLLETLTNALYEPKYKFPAYVTKSAKNYLFWILLAILRHKSFEKILTSNNYEANTITNLSNIELNFIKHIEFADLTKDNSESEFEICQISDLIRQKLEYKVPDSGQGVFSKYSVSELKKYIENETDSKDYFEKLIKISNLDESQKVTSAKRGSAIHKVFELLDLKNTNSVEDVEEFVNLLVTKEFISPAEASLIPCDKIYAFFETDIGKKLKNAIIVRREVPFNIHISEKFVPATPDSFKVQLQGVIDCYFKDDDCYTIIDFKSDKLTCQNKADKIKSYKKQLEFYILALNAMHKNTPIKACIYFLDDNSTVWL